MENSVEELCFFGIFRGNKIVKLARNGLIKFASYFFTGFFLEIFRTEWLPFKDTFFNCWSWLITWLTWSRNLLWIESVVRKLYTRLMSQVRTSSIVSPYQKVITGSSFSFIPYMEAEISRANPSSTNHVCKKYSLGKDLITQGLV